MPIRSTWLLALTLPLAGHATTWTVGPGQNYTLPSQVSTLVGDGDTVDIEAGEYPSDVARWQANDLVLRGVGGMAHMESNGMAWGGKAIWVIQGDRTTVEWIGFSECSVPDQNGAGIRQEGHDLTVRHCWFHDNEDGILAGEIHPSTIRIEYSEFGHNGFGDGYSHNVYIGHVDSLIFRFNYSHHGFIGHELKSRAWVNVIEYNRLSNEADGEASREIDLPDGGQAYVIGNVIQQGPQGQNSNMVAFGMESLGNPGPQELYAVNNTLVNEKTNGSFFQAPAELFFKAYNNILAGGGSFISGAWPTDIDTLANLRATDITAVQFADAATYDYHINDGSPAHNIGFPAGLANSGYPLVALYEYVHPTGDVLRCQHATLDAGAFETCTTGIAAEKTSGWAIYPDPAVDQVTITVPLGVVITHVEFIDAQGRVVKGNMATMADKTILDVSRLTPGSYIARISTSAGMWRSALVKLP